MKKFVGDFETCTWLENKTYVWGWALCEIGNEENLKIGNDIQVFLQYLKNENNPILYMHNLAFDGEFLIYYLLTNGFKHIDNKNQIDKNTFMTLISETGQFYKFTIYFSKGQRPKKLEIIDSQKIIPFSVEKIPKAFGLKENKLSIDYKKQREIGHILTKQEEDYLKNDVVIVAKALNQLFSEGLTHMTQSSNAMKDFKTTLSRNSYMNCFPILKKEISEDIKLAYKGGYSYLNPIYKEKNLNDIKIIDCNSLYPYIMKTMFLPYGEPIYFEGQYKKEFLYGLYVQMISVLSFKLKERKTSNNTIKTQNGIYA